MNAKVRTSDPLRGARAPDGTVRGLLLLLCPLLSIQAAARAIPRSLAAVPRNEQDGSQGYSRPAKPTVKGEVRDESGAALAGVRITLIDQHGSSPITTTTNEDGSYELESPPPGTYTVTATVAGFAKQSRSGLVLAGSQSVVTDFSLHREDAGQHRSGAAKTAATSAGLGGFDYYDKPEYKAGSINAASPASGYSAAAEADSYGLILAYVQAEKDSVSLAGGPMPPNTGEPQPSPAAGEESTDGRNENQFFSHGSDLLLHRQFAPATATFERALAHFPDSAKLETGLGVALYAQGQYEKAVKALIRATELMPSDPGAYLLLARAYNASSSESGEVVSRLRHLVEIEPRNAQAHYYYALSLWKGKQASEADLSQVEGLLKSAVELDPQFFEAHIELGALYALQARYSQAIDEYQAAIRLKPDLATAHYRLAQVYLRTGDKAAAATELDTYQRLRGNQPDTRP